MNSPLNQANRVAKEGIIKCETHTEKMIYTSTFSFPNITAVEAAKHIKDAPRCL